MIILLLIMAGTGLAGYLIYRMIVRKTRAFSRTVFGTDSLTEGLRRQEEQLAYTPKSVSGMTRIYLPQIMKDFPEFSLPEFVQKAENQLKAVLKAVEAQDLQFLTEVSADLKEQVRVWIEDNKQSGIREHFQNVRIHQSEISRYQKQAGSCVIVLQSSVGYKYYQSGKDRTGGLPKQKQTRYESYLMYIQDAALISDQGKAVAIVCPQCGAPVTGIGHKTCEYCGSAVVPVNIRCWALTKLKEV